MDERKSLPLLVVSANPFCRRSGCFASHGRLMQSFDYGHAADIGEALANGGAPNTVFLAGGTELLNWLRLGVAKPARVIDLRGSRDLPTSRACRAAGSA